MQQNNIMVLDIFYFIEAYQSRLESKAGFQEDTSSFTGVDSVRP